MYLLILKAPGLSESIAAGGTFHDNFSLLSRIGGSMSYGS